MFRHVAATFVAWTLVTLASPADAGVDARMLTFPDVSETQICFVYAGDIWVVAKEGGLAYRLSTPAGHEIFPRFSPDGKQIAFTGNYDGNSDIYSVPSSGGATTRLTHHPMSDRMLDWYPDGKSILYATSMESGKQRFRQFYRLPKTGGLPEKLQVPYGEFGMISSDGRKLAYMPVSRDFRTWKRYRGGSVTDIWVFDLTSNDAKNVTQNNSNDGQPMWHGSTLYFVSDRDNNKRSNIWAYDTKDQSTRQVTKFTDYDVRFPSIGPSDLVFENGARLYRLDLADEKVHEVEVEVVTDRGTLRPRTINVSELIFSGDISPTGKRAVIEARGEVFTLPAEHGVVRNLTRSSGVAERHPAWSPDGKEIAYFSDRSGEYELTVRETNGTGKETQLTKLGPGYRYYPYWAPDGQKIAYVDQAMKIWIYDREADKTTLVDQGLWMYQGGLSGFRASWTADSRWMAYSRGLDTRQRAIFLYDTEKNERHQVTAGFYDDSTPEFDPDGKYLYFRSGRTLQPVYSDQDTTWVYNNTTNIVAVPLREDVPSPLHERNDDEETEDDEDNGDDDNGDDDNGDDDNGDDDNGKKGKKDKKKGEGKDDDEEGEEDEDEEEEPEPVEIDLEGLEARLVVLPPEAGNYRNLNAVSGKIVYLRMPRTGSGGSDSAIVYYDLEEREEKTVLGSSDGFEISADGKKILVASNGKFAILDLAPDQKIEKPLRTEQMEMELDPPAEWRQIFTDAWRLERDYFYDPDMHGVDWDDMRKRYGKLLDDAVTRWDLNFIIGELIAELNASHAYRGGGDTEQPERRSIGMLGVDYTLENGAYRFAKIIDGAPWDSEVRSPLNEPGLEVNEGDYLLAVNDAPVDTSKDPWAAFEGLADKTVQLTINDKPTLEGSRKVLVKTLSSETRLRNLAWIESNRKKVDEATDGRVGYIYVPDTGRNGQTELVRMFQPQFTKDALIIDERFNNGGQIPTRFVELLARPIVHYWGVRDGQDWQWPPVSHIGPKTMLINQWSGSGGDAFPWYFKVNDLGPLIGMRTWGGLIGITGAPRLIDGGVATVPTFGSYGVDGEWAVEGHGIDPDIEVVDDPSLMVDGGDPQLERAIEEMLNALKTAPPKHPNKPPYPNRSK